MNDVVEKNSIPQQREIENNFISALQVVDDIILKNYIVNLDKFDVVPLNEENYKNNLEDNVRIFKITEMVYSKDEFAIHKFATVFNALSNVNCSVFVIANSDGEKTEFYMGIQSMDPNRTSSSVGKMLLKAMNGQFPGVKTENCKDKKIKEIVENIKITNVSSVTCVANAKDSENKNNLSFIQGLEKLALSMHGEKYTAIILASTVSQGQMLELKKSYENIYTQISGFSQSQVSYAVNDSVNLSEAKTKGTSYGTSTSTNTSKTEGISITEGTTISHSVSKASGKSKAIKGASFVTNTLGIALAPLTGGASYWIGGGISAGLGLLGTAVGENISDGVTENTGTTRNDSNTYGETNGTSETTSDSSTFSRGSQTGSSQTIMKTITNKEIENILNKLDVQMDRINDFESLGIWECAAYFMSDDPQASEIAASTYKALMSGENSGVEISAINSWGELEKEKTTQISKYVKNFLHPVFSYEKGNENIEITPSSFVSGNELAIHMGLPRNSVCGFPVIEHADFGKEVVTYEDNLEDGYNSSKLKLGKIFNMGSETNTMVKLDKESLSMHTFVTGSTGSGKSNTIYEIIKQLSYEGVNFMIVEPAKGEYKNIFGDRNDVLVLGTNPDYSQLLKINPFKFPKKIHILEHVDRLIEIFNVCWPMYAAMPAVLKDAVLQAYEACGWNLTESTNKYSEEFFPTFIDLKNELVDVITKSDYAPELKSNYMGSLLTRVKTLTNGLNGQIFSSREIDNKTLFDENVIVDLSRVGSSETKSLIMGVLVMRLNEYRMSTTIGMNTPLKHITVLEEAHNILKRTSTETNPDSSNMTGKSVEMLSNAIAEMRTYGEGFIIADQSPHAVDMSAIRNTNTKIIMRLPDEMDRRVAGKAAALKDEQLDEIAKLPRGVAVVYQNNWLESVLCKVKKFDGEEKIYDYKDRNSTSVVDEKKYLKELVFLLLKGITIEKIEPDMDFLEENLRKVEISTKNKIEINKLLKEYKETKGITLCEEKRYKDLSKFILEIFRNNNEVFRIIDVYKSRGVSLLNENLFDFINMQIEGISSEVKFEICQCFMYFYAESDLKKMEWYDAWKIMKERGKF